MDTSHPSQTSMPGSVPHRVLVIDDDPDIRDMLTILLEADGFVIARAETGAAGLSLFDMFRPDLILLDARMPTLDGFETCTRLRASVRGVDLPIVMMTALHDAASVERAFAVGADDVLVKPFHLTLLRMRIRHLLQSHQRARNLEASETLLRRAFDDATIGMTIVALDESYLRVNTAFCTMLGYTQTELVGRSFRDVTHPDDLQADLVALEHARGGLLQSYQVEKRYVRKDGTIIWCLLNAALVQERDESMPYIVCQIQDITERKRVEAELIQYAFYDRLTGLPNRPLFLDRLGHALDRLRRGAAGTCAVFFLDLDRFKVVNDSLGHLVGDQLLVDTAARLLSIMRTPDTLARFGGDEFAILLEDLDDAMHVEHLAKRIQRAFATPFMLDEHQVVVSASIGIALTRTGEEQPMDLVRNADLAMYQAKTRGKGRHAVFDPSMHMHALERLQMESELRRAIERGAFVLHYQPIVHLTNGKMVGVEALVRWEHPQRGLIPPTTFIPIAEETGLILPLGTWILRAACAQMVAWQTEDVAPAYISVNVSAEQVHHPDLASTIRTILDETGLAPASLALEVTETGMMEDVTLATTVLAQVQALGVQVLAVDDWGTGYASLSYLQQLPVTHIKIDRAFVHDITTNPSNAELVQAMIVMAHALNLQTIAEGTETDDQRSLLRAYGCDAFQGYLVSRPVAAAALLTLLQQER